MLLAVTGLHDWVDFPLVAESGVYSSLWCLALPWCRQALGAWGFSRCSSWAPEHRFNSWGATKLLQGMWDLLGQGTESVSHALASRFFTTEPPGNSYLQFFFFSSETHWLFTNILFSLYLCVSSYSASLVDPSLCL